jgi:hypothetical protein
MFLPLQLAAGESLRSLTSSKIGGRTSINEQAMQDWLKSGKGCIPTDCKVSVESMRTESVGQLPPPQKRPDEPWRMPDAK